MSKVIFFKSNILENLGLQVNRLTNGWEQGSRVAIKAHLGEYGNLYHVRPQIVGRVAEELKVSGLNPFVYDTIVKYPGSRDTKEKYQDTARRHGFTQATLGCPVIISDQVNRVKTPKLEVGVVDVLKDVKYHVVISHAKGHISAGFGGAIKNLGMGCVGAKTKGLLHEKTKPKLVGVCVKCGACVKVCPKQAITVDEKDLPRTKPPTESDLQQAGAVGDPENITAVNRQVLSGFSAGWRVDYEKCWGCGYCIEECPENALAPLEDSLTHFLAEASAPIVQGRINLFINIAMNITARCDCARNPKPPICPDIGVFISGDPVAIDSATIEAIKKVCPEFFGGIVKADPSSQIQTGQELGLSEAKYELEEVRG